MLFYMSVLFIQMDKYDVMMWMAFILLTRFFSESTIRFFILFFGGGLWLA